MLCGMHVLILSSNVTCHLKAYGKLILQCIRTLESKLDIQCFTECEAELLPA